MRISSPLNDCFKRVHNFTLAGSKSMNSCSPCSMVIKVFRWNETDASAVVHCPTFVAKSYLDFWFYMSFMNKLSFASCDQTWCFQRPPPGFDEFDKVRLIWLKMSIWHKVSQEARFQHPSPNFPLNSLSDENARWYHCSTFLSECEDGWIKIVHILEELGFLIYITPQTETHLSQINLSYFWTYYINNS